VGIGAESLVFNACRRVDNAFVEKIPAVGKARIVQHLVRMVVGNPVQGVIIKIIGGDDLAACTDGKIQRADASKY
jgi:hypothetical protein